MSEKLTQKSMRPTTRSVTRNMASTPIPTKNLNSTVVKASLPETSTMENVLVPQEETMQPIIPRSNCTENRTTSKATTSKKNKKLLLEQLMEEEALLDRKMAIVKLKNELLADETETELSSTGSVCVPIRVQDWIEETEAVCKMEQACTKNELPVLPSTNAQTVARHAVLSDLPKFDGNQVTWANFIATFKRTTDMFGYCDEENLIRLEKCLVGKARETVECLLMHPKNVSQILDSLTMKYGQPVRIIHELTNKVSALPNIKEADFAALVDMSIQVQNYCSTVEACELKGYMYNDTLLYKLVMKLPPTLQLRWAEYTPIQDVTLQTFCKWLTTIAKAACKITPLDSEIPCTSRSLRAKPKGRFVNVHTDNKPTTTSQPSQTSVKNCHVCKGDCKTVSKCIRFIEFSCDSRWDAVRELSLCRSCLNKHHGRCYRTQVCGIDGCRYKHHPLLHHSQSRAQTSNELQCNFHHGKTSDVLFRVIPVRVYGQSSVVDTYAFMDDGSEITLIDESLANELKLEGPCKPLCLKWTNDVRHREESSKTVSLKISGKQGGEMCFIRGAQTVKQLQLPKQSLNMDDMSKRYPHLCDIPAESYHDVTPRILLGLDHAKLTSVKKSREGDKDQPIAAKTRLGWTIYGSCSKRPESNSFTHQYSLQINKCECDESMHNEMKNYFALDSMGVDMSSKDPVSREDERALQLLSEHSKLIGKRYESCLLWKYDNVRLPDSKAMALKRWKCLEQRMLRDKELANAMDNKIREYQQKQYIRKLTPAELNEKHERVWYLPIFPVINPNKPGKIRIVWDAAAKAFGVSLNTALLKGPDQVSSLPSVLVKFREFRVGITGDIREMFHQVLIRREDQHSQRFFWKPETSTGKPTEYIMCVMTFGASCSPSTAQFIKNTNAKRFANDYPAATRVILEQHYVDDMLASVESEEEAIQLAEDVKHVHSEGGFEIRNWLSNSKLVLNKLNVDSNTEKSMDIGLPLPTEKVLGMYWCTHSDSFTYKLSPRYDQELLHGKRAPTKREVLRMLMMVYDPLGLISHVLMYLKVLIQDIWRTDLDWDDPIQGTILEKWRTWLGVLPLLEHVEIPRCYRTRTSINHDNVVQLHTFVDASESGFAAAVYLRFEEQGVIECCLVSAKTRVAPLKYLSIPRAELQAGVLGVRLSSTIKATLSISVTEQYFWTDSRDLLCWIRSDHRRYSPYVACRIGEILEKTNISEWRWVPSKQNVADDGTKWERKPDVSKTSRWFCGPQFLYNSKSEWPPMPFTTETTAEELRPHVLVHCQTPKSVVQFDRFSRWTRLYRTMAYVFRAVRCFRKALQKNTKTQTTQVKRVPPLEKEELVRAQNWLYQLIQIEAFPDEYALIKEHQPVKTSSSLHRLAPFIDEDKVLKVRGRINAERLTDLHVQHAVILPSKHHVTELIVKHFHHSLLHRNHETAINLIRLQFHIPGIRKIYRKMRGNCQLCKNEASVPNPPMMGDLPEARLAAYSHAFAYVGVDYFGPLMVSVGRRCEKRWGVIVTCLTTRAIHLELVNSLTTSSCIMALRCFMARRGVPNEIHSDNGTNFRGASRELAEALKSIDHNKIIQEIVSPNTAWKFIPPGSPHMGGAWERMVQTVKRNLAGKRLANLPSDEVLRNALTEIEYIINSRPLTHIPIDDESASVLTPNHFLLGSAGGLKPLASSDDSIVPVKRGWEMSQIMANSFWKHWLQDYLPIITRRSKWFKSVKPIAVGDIVIIVDPNGPRNTWPRGRVIAVHTSKDGQVRKATIQTATGIYERPAVKLAVLDVGVSSST